MIALKLLEENPKEKDEYQCAFLQSPVTDLSHYRRNESISEVPANDFLRCLDAAFTERVDGWTENDKSVSR